MKKNILFDGLRSVARIGETAVVAAKAGIKYATEKPSNAKLMRETFESLGDQLILSLVSLLRVLHRFSHVNM